MIIYMQGNLLEADVEALVNTVNTVGVMGKGIALMFKERFPENMKRYSLACKNGSVVTGKMFVTESNELIGPKWIINFPTKKHWRSPSKMEWIVEGLEDLKRVIIENKIRSIAIPPLGSGNGGLEWSEVKALIESKLSNLDGVQLLVYEPTSRYMNVEKPRGKKSLTPARALIAETVRRYWILGFECSLLEIQKMAWFLERSIEMYSDHDPLNLQFSANHYGPYADRLRHLLDALDGSYLISDKRIADSGPLDVIRFNDVETNTVKAYLKTEGKDYSAALRKMAEVVDGFESPFGLELLSTVDWLVNREGCERNILSVRDWMARWPAGRKWAERKQQLFDERSIGIALERLESAGM